MRLYILYALLVASILVAAIAVTPNLSERLRHGLIVAVSLLVIVPGILFLILEGG